MKRFLVFALLIGLGIAGYLVYVYYKHRYDKPPFATQALNVTDLPPSYIQAPVSVSENDMLRAIRQELPNPVTAGKSPAISAKLLATEPISFTDLKQELVSPAQPAHIAHLARTEMRAIRESFSTVLRPWKIIHGWRDVIRPVTIPFDTLIPRVEAVYKYTATPVIRLIDKIYPVSATVNYSIGVQDLSLKLSGNTITATVSTRTHIRIDYDQPTIPGTGEKIVIKGLTSFDLDNQFTVSGNVNINDAMGLDVTLNEDQTALDFKDFPVKLAFTGIDLFAYTNPAWLAYKKAVTAILKSAVNGAIAKKIDDSEDSLKLKDKLVNAAAKLNNPWMISKNLWLLANAREASLSDLDTYEKDGDTYLRINVGFIARPEIIYSPDTPKLAEIPIVIKKASAVNPGVDARVQLVLDYASASKTLADTLKTFIDQKVGKIPLTTGQVQIYPSGERLVIGIDFGERGGDKIGTVYLWGHPRFDPATDSLVIDSLGYYLASESIVLRTLNDVLSAKLLVFIQDKCRWSLDSLLTDSKLKFRQFTYPTEYGNIVGSLTSLSIGDINAGKDHLSLYGEAKGQISFQVLPLKILLARSSPKNDTSHISTPKPGQKPIDVAINRVGQNMYVQVADSFVIRPVTFKDKTIPGDTIFYKGPDNTVSYYIIQKADLKAPLATADFGVFTDSGLPSPHL